MMALSSRRFLVFTKKQTHELFAPLVKTSWLSRFVLCQSVRRDDGQRHCRIEITDYGVGQAIGIDFAPGYCLARRGARKSARVRARISHLQKIIVPTFVDAQDLLDLR